MKSSEDIRVELAQYQGDLVELRNELRFRQEIADRVVNAIEGRLTKPMGTCTTFPVWTASGGKFEIQVHGPKT